MRVRDGTVAAILAATAELPAKVSNQTSAADASPDDAEDVLVFAEPDARTSRREDSAVSKNATTLVKDRASVEWLGSETSEASEEASEETVATTRSRDDSFARSDASDEKENDDARMYTATKNETFVETETALGEATQRCLESYYALGGGGGSDAPVSDDAYGFGETPDAPDHVYVPHELPDAAGLERILRAFAKDASISAASKTSTTTTTFSTDEDIGGASDEKETDGQKKRRNRPSRPVLRHGAELPAGLPSALASLARTPRRRRGKRRRRRRRRAWRRLGMARRGATAPLVVEGIDISHLAGANTSASVAVFVDGKAAPERHRRYEIATGAGEGRVAPGDDPAAIRAAMGKRIAAAKRAVSGKSAAKVLAADALEPMSTRVPGALPDLALIDGGAAQLIAAARACLAAGVEVSNARRNADVENDATANGQTGSRFPPQSLPPSGPFSVALASLAKGRVSGEESVFVPRAVVDESGAVVDFAADRLVVGRAPPHARREKRSRGRTGRAPPTRRARRVARGGPGRAEAETTHVSVPGDALRARRRAERRRGVSAEAGEKRARWGESGDKWG